MNNQLKIAALSLPIVWADKQANLQAVAEAMAQLEPDTDLVVLPELFTTAFVADEGRYASLAEDAAHGPTAKALAALAARHHMAIAGSVMTTGAHPHGGDGGDGGVANTAFFIEPSGECAFYDKRHLFALSPEARQFTAGRRHAPVVRYRGWNIAMAVCFDLRFPVWCRNRHLAYDVMLVPANWPQARRYAWEHLLIARAIENQAYWVGANRSGSDDYGLYDGMTLAFDPMGQPAGRDAMAGSVAVTYVEAARQVVDDARRRMPVDRSADDFHIRL